MAKKKDSTSKSVNAAMDAIEVDAVRAAVEKDSAAVEKTVALVGNRAIRAEVDELGSHGINVMVFKEEERIDAAIDEASEAAAGTEETVSQLEAELDEATKKAEEKQVKAAKKDAAPLLKMIEDMTDFGDGEITVQVNNPGVIHLPEEGWVVDYTLSFDTPRGSSYSKQVCVTVPITKPCKVPELEKLSKKLKTATAHRDELKKTIAELYKRRQKLKTFERKLRARLSEHVLSSSENGRETLEKLAAVESQPLPKIAKALTYDEVK
jgi:septal ring factor EnvC (AmiA/AmiB activator)